MGRVIATPRPPESLPLPLRFALLGERARAFLQILGTQHGLNAAQAVMQFEGLMLADHLTVAEQLFDGGKQQRRPCRQLRGDLARLGQR